MNAFEMLMAVTKLPGATALASDTCKEFIIDTVKDFSYHELLFNAVAEAFRFAHK
jgi:hypothetical protein